MTKFLLTILFLVFSLQISAQNIDTLRKELNQIIATKNATIGVSIKAIEDKDTLNINGNLNAPLMSVFKFHIALTTLHLVDKGKLSLNQKFFIKKEDLHENTWSPIRDEFPNGNIYLTLDQLLRYTVSHSDNNGCDILLELIGGAKTVQKFINKHDIKDFVIKLNEQDMRIWENLYVNTTTPLATTELLENFYNIKVLKKKTTEYLYQIMVETSRGNTWMKAGLPEGTELAHRTGISGTNENGLRGAMNDVGIFKLPNGKHIILSIYLKNITEEREDSEKMIADLTKATWNYFTKNLTKEFIKSEIKLDTLTLFDQSRNRSIPIAIYQPKDKNKLNNIPILLSHGYGKNNGSDYLNAYTYLTEFLASQGYFVVSIQHELKSDEPLAMHGVLKETRMPSWERGVLNMQFVLQEIKNKYPELKFDELALIGHSQGGDMVALFAQEHPEIVKKIITMDNRRMKLPLTSKPMIFTLRCNDYPADDGVLPTNEEKEKYNITVQFTNINHNTMDNDANETERVYLQTKILEYLKK